MKGCPFNQFGPCRKDECRFYIDTGVIDTCMISDLYHNVTLDQSFLMELVTELARDRRLEPQRFSSRKAYEEHCNSLLGSLDRLVPRLNAIRDALKGDKS
jgi:hypothetical protein